MKSLLESLLDDFEDIEKSQDNRQEVVQFLKENYYRFSYMDIFEHFKVSDKPNRRGKYEVKWIIKYQPCEPINKELKQLTNGMFVFTGGYFMIRNLKRLENLEGFSKKFKGSIHLIGNDMLTSLEGAPEEITLGDFKCISCHGLKTLEGASVKINGDCVIKGCPKLTSLKGAPKFIKGIFDITDNKSLKSLEGCPESITTLYCNDDFNKEDIKKYCHPLKIIIAK